MYIVQTDKLLRETEENHQTQDNLQVNEKQVIFRRHYNIPKIVTSVELISNYQPH